MENKNQFRLYQKLSTTYTLVVLLIVGVLTTYFIYSSKHRAEEMNLDIFRQMEQDATSYLAEAAGISSYIHRELYRSQAELADIVSLMTKENEDYQKYRLDTYASSNSLDYSDTYSFIGKAFEAYADIVRIELVSYTKEEMTVCTPNGSFWTRKTGERLYQILENRLVDSKEFSFRREIRDTVTGTSVGCIIFVFDEKPLEKIHQQSSQSSLFVMDLAGALVWGEMPCPMETFNTLKNSGELEKVTQAFIEKESVGDYVVFAFLDKKLARWLPMTRILLILSVSAALIVIGKILINLYLGRLNRRLEAIIQGMEQIAYGNLAVRLPVNTRGDELDLISANFNQMCGDLDAYIQKSYLAEIERQNAEMQALQNQMNPHFLYNTLEAIRMKAICNGDREVGKMLYSMAVTFRAQLKEKDVITLAQELHYCKNYLELFEYRYKDRFHVRVECPTELLELSVIKFILQPIIENYFVHGIRLEESDNEIYIWTETEKECLRIHVEDNGKGIEPEKMEKMNEELRQNHYEVRDSIGVANVNRRIKAVYGEKYGIRLQQGKPRGTHIILEIKTEEKICRPLDETVNRVD